MSTGYVSAELERQVRSDADHRCGYCQASEAITGMSLTIDHIIPEAAGGQTARDNLWLACERCNRCKGDRTAGMDPVTGHHERFFNPRTQVWHEHFTWDQDGTQIVGLTPIGRAIVVALRLNHPLALIARQLWVGVGWHPPHD